MWWDVDTWLNSYRPYPGGVIDPQKWHEKFMSGVYIDAMYGPIPRGPMGWVCRLRTTLSGIEYWAYVPNNTKDPVEWYTVHNSGLCWGHPTKKIHHSLQRLYDELPVDGGEMMVAYATEKREGIAALWWVWWVMQKLPPALARHHCRWVARFGPDAVIPVSAIRENVAVISCRIRGNGYARYARRFDTALVGLRKTYPAQFRELA